MPENTNDVFPKYKQGEIEAYALGTAGMSRCIDSISSILESEGCRRASAFNGKTALNLDAYERLVHSQEFDSTVDMVIGCDHHELLMVEIKLRASNVADISQSVLDKIRYSRNLIINKVGYHPFRIAIVLLDDSRFEQKKNKLYRLLGNKPNIIKALTVKGFYGEVFE